MRGTIILVVILAGATLSATAVPAQNKRASDTKAAIDPIAKDPLRPKYHFLPPRNWMNDPNGLIHRRGEYHLFYQHNPNGAFWGSMHWGHAVSRDLVYWKHLPIALRPTPGGPDKDGVFSGCAVEADGVPVLIYTGVQPEVQCIARGADDMITWEKYEGNPVIASPPEGFEVTGFRDPYVWRENDVWYMVVGSGIKDVGGTVFLYKSVDLIHWDFLHPICVGDKNKTGHMWECPNFFRLGDKHVLIVSPVPLRKSIYFIGTYENYKFTPETEGVLDTGGHFYAPQTFLDAGGRRIMFGWLWEGRRGEAQLVAGWAGVQSLPRILSLRHDGTLGMEPASELKKLRGEHHQFSDVEITPDAGDIPADVRGDALEILAEFEPGKATQFGIRVRCSPDREEYTSIVYDGVERQLLVDREHSSLSPDVSRGVQGGPFAPAEGEPLRLHIFVDCSVVEVFANDRACVTHRIYPIRADSVGVELFARDGNVKAKLIDIWELKSIWADK